MKNFKGAEMAQCSGGCVATQGAEGTFCTVGVAQCCDSGSVSLLRALRGHY